MNTNDDTLKIVGLPKFNEIDYYQHQYDEALTEMLSNPTQENIEEFGKWNAKLYETQDCYRVGQRLLIDRSRQLQLL